MATCSICGTERTEANAHDWIPARITGGDPVHYGNACRDALRARLARCESALKQIQSWDMLNPPDTATIADARWLRHLVDRALSAPPSEETRKECTCGEDDSPGPSLPHKTWCPKRGSEETRKETRRVANIDGMDHVAGSDDCCRVLVCRKCKGRQHYQGVYGGYVELCETCDAQAWKDAPGGGEVG